MPSETNSQTSGPMNVGAWLNAERAAVFRKHIRKGDSSSYAAAAIEEKLRRDGYWPEEGNAEAAAVIKSIPAAALPLLAEIVELIKVRPAELKAAIADIKAGALETAGADLG